MRIVEANKNEEILKTDSYSLPEVAPLTHKSYHELSDRPVVETDVIAQLHANLETLTDLQGRFSFLMREVRYLLKV